MNEAETRAELIDHALAELKQSILQKAFSGQLIIDKENIIYQEEGQAVEVRLDTTRNTVWLSQKQMADLFGKDVRTVNEHIKNVFYEGELDQEKLPHLLELKYHAVGDAVAELGPVANIRDVFIGFQEYLYVRQGGS